MGSAGVAGRSQDPSGAPRFGPGGRWRLGGVVRCGARGAAVRAGGRGSGGVYTSGVGAEMCIRDSGRSQDPSGAPSFGPGRLSRFRAVDRCRARGAPLSAALLVTTMNQPSSVREDPQSVSGVLTAESVPKPGAIRTYSLTLFETAPSCQKFFSVCAGRWTAGARGATLIEPFVRPAFAF